MDKLEQKISRVAQDGFRSLVKSTFLERCRANEKYSMRAFARDLDIDQSFLSKLLRSKKDFTTNTILKIGKGLNLPSEELDNYINENKFNDLEEDYFQIVSDWYHFAILELLKVNKIERTVSQISESLGMEFLETKEAIERLERTGFIVTEKNEIKLIKKNNDWTNFSTSSEARKQLQYELSMMAAKAVKEVPFDQRENASLTVACNSKILPEIKSKIKNFWKELNGYIEDQDESDRVYQLTVGFFPLSK